MSRNDLKQPTIENFYLEIHANKKPLATLRSTGQPAIGFALCALGFVICVLLMVAPLARMPDRVTTLHIAVGSLLATVGSWLPSNFGLASNPLDARGSTACIEFFLLLALAGICYGLGALLVQRRAEASNQRSLRYLIWASAILAGTIYVLTPAMLSHDIVAYASYGRVLAVYHSNPYFVAIATFPHDPFTSVNYWSKTVSAYGPIWMFVCGFFGLLLHPTLADYTLAFRFFALAMHLLNTWLVGCTLRQMDRAPRTVTLGMLLYAWNPLALLESSLGGHNDVLMVTFVLLSILLAVRAEKRGQLLLPRGYLPPVVALTLATLVKFTALPILATYLIFLICKTLRPTTESSHELKQALRNWRPALALLAGSLLSVLLVALAFYGPFWFGHSPQAIASSFKDVPSSLYSQNSFMRATTAWLNYKPATTFPYTLLTYRRFWDLLTYLALASGLILGTLRLWSRPTTKTFVLAALATLGAVLLITPWFFSWYITWIIGLVVVCLPLRQGRVQSALLAFTLTFSFSALLTYLFVSRYQPFDSWAYLVSILTTVPPTCAFLLALVLWRPARHSTIRSF